MYFRAGSGEDASDIIKLIKSTNQQILALYLLKNAMMHIFSVAYGL